MDRALSAACQAQAHEDPIAGRTVPHASGMSHWHVQQIAALIALQAHWAEIGLSGKSPRIKV
jgi:hypothetical protein